VQITSSTNPLVKAIRRASRRGGLTDDGFAVAESPHLLEEAARTGLEIHATLVADSSSQSVLELAERLHPTFHTVPDKIFRELSSTENSQGLISLVKLPPHDWSDLLQGAACVVILDGVQDPGNAGGIVRTAEAFGADAIIFGQGTASPTNPKTLRASAGSLFRVPFVKAGPIEGVVEALRAAELPLFAATAHDGEPLGQAALDRAAIVIGSEGHGVSREYLDAAQAVYIPVAGVESLNAAAAAAVLLYVAAEQRSREA
jgi:TrmH family RNA methyltransferase